MQLPQSKTHQAYINQVKAVEDKLKAATAEGKNQTLLSQVQNEIDRLAEKYQYDKDIGKAVYKLYELQALAHYFNGEDNDALDFINQAIETRGGSYTRAEKLKEQLSKKSTPKAVDPRKMTKQERRKQKIGLEGWLAFFIVIVGINILLGAIGLAGYGSAFGDLASLQSDIPDYVAAMTPVLWFEMLTSLISIGLAVGLLISLAKHKRFAKWLAVVYLVFNAITICVDYAWISSVFDAFNLSDSVRAEMKIAARDVTRSITGVLIWVPYFFVSKRIKATLTK